MKVGRNDTCPCGSGLKYKKCCINKENTNSPKLSSNESNDQPEMTCDKCGQKFETVEGPTGGRVPIRCGCGCFHANVYYDGKGEVCLDCGKEMDF